MWAEAGKYAIDHLRAFQAFSTFAARALLWGAVGDAFIALDGGSADQLARAPATGLRNTRISRLDRRAGIFILDVSKRSFGDILAATIGDLLAVEVFHIDEVITVVVESVRAVFGYKGIDIGVFVITIENLAAVASGAMPLATKTVFVIVAGLFVELRDAFVLLIAYEARGAIFIRFTPEFFREGIEFLGTGS